uniref:TSP1_CCN domain-containing protein n=1 Tax=Steinernema glaseri TaxID=37863 RepID=A0A1I8AIM1_9BILA
MAESSETILKKSVLRAVPQSKEQRSHTAENPFSSEVRPSTTSEENPCESDAPTPTVEKTSGLTEESVPTQAKEVSHTEESLDVPDEVLQEKTISERVIDKNGEDTDQLSDLKRVIDENGEDTDQLSDLSDQGDALLQSTNRNMFTTWYKRLHPLIRNRQVRYLAVFNFVLSLANVLLFLGITGISIYAIYLKLRRLHPLIRNRQVRYLAVFNFVLSVANVLLFLGITGISIYAIYLKLRIRAIHNQDKPCVYEWGEWSACSAECWDGNGAYPNRTRKVDMDTLVQARGGNPSCPKNIATWRDSVSCNRYKCERNLSNFTFGAMCFFNDPIAGASKGCYRIREVPTEAQLIKVDAAITKPCGCQKYLRKEKNSRTLGKAMKKLQISNEIQ